MSTPWTRSALALSVVLSGAFVANVLALQDWRGRGGAEIVTGASRPQSQARDAGRAPGAAPWAEQFAARGQTTSPARTGDGGDRIELTRAIQRELGTRGYEAGAVDGVAGTMTRAAIMAYEFDRELTLTAEPSQELLQHILLGMATPTGMRAAEGEAASPRARAVIASVQRALKQLGHASGPEATRLTPELQRAIRQFEAAQGLRPTGRISGPLVARLSRATGQALVSAAP